jgi:hypothetical protein
METQEIQELLAEFTKQNPSWEANRRSVSHPMSAVRNSIFRMSPATPPPPTHTHTDRGPCLQPQHHKAPGHLTGKLQE